MDQVLSAKVSEIVEAAVEAYRARLRADLERVLGAQANGHAAAITPFFSAVVPDDNGATVVHVHTRAKRGGSASKPARSKRPAVIDAIAAAGAIGVRSDVLRATTGLTRSKLQTQIKALIAEKKIRKTGVKRGTTYFAR